MSGIYGVLGVWDEFCGGERESCEFETERGVSADGECFAKRSLTHTAHTINRGKKLRRIYIHTHIYT